MALYQAIEQPSLAFAQAAKVYGPHLGALHVAELYQRLTGKQVSFKREEGEDG